MQVANDVTSTNELPTREARPGGALTTPPLPESCRRAASRAAVVTASKRAVAILESTSKQVSTADCRA